jgi:hypothetical protein
MNFYDFQDRFIDQRIIDRAMCLIQPRYRLTLGGFRLCIGGRRSEAVHGSLGVVSTFADRDRVLRFIHGILAPESAGTA